MKSLDADGFGLDLEQGIAPARPNAAVSGTQLRHRLITADVLAAIDADEVKPTMLQRIFGCK